ncbi:MAG: nuclear transport factor 2 family protein [Gammaproteobacteria bacterium]|nr:nuclear transport factor 2 family protein [Gammaproteobacteria bacterium]
MSATNLQIVRLFLETLAGGDMARTDQYLSDDVLYHNLPWEPMTGSETVRNFLQPFVDGTHSAIARMEILHQVGDGDVVMNARSETWKRGDLEVVLPVAGLFVLKDNLIVKWSDYWDLATFQPLLDAIAG